VQLWRKSDHKTFTFQALDPAAAWVDGNSETDCYMAAGLAAKATAPNKRRATKQQVVGIAGVWADIDINGGPEGKRGAARDLDEALDLCEVLLQPTVLVNSGYGLQAWWLFDDGVWTFNDTTERDAAQKVVAGFQGALKAEAKRRGYTIDSTFDLARLMRVPGGSNHKGPSAVPVELLDDGGPRHSRSKVEAVGEEYQHVKPSGLSLISGEGVEIEVKDHAQPNMTKLMQLWELDQDFKDNWNHNKTTKNAHWSMSEYEFSFVNVFTAGGWTDQEICDALVFHRLYHEPGDPKGKNRAERIAQTIGKVRATRQYEDDSVSEETDREQAADELAAIAGDGGLDPVRTIGIFNRVLKGPEVKTLVQKGRDPETCRYVLALANGDEVPLTPDQLFNAEQFRNRFAVVTKFRPKRLKGDKWDEVVQALLDAADLHEDVEDTRGHRATEWVRAYTERRTSSDKDAACQANDPFTQSGNLYIPLGPFHQWLRKVQGERVADPDVRAYLEAAGFERKTINYMKDTGDRSTRSYFVAPLEGV
jgi:hypothetical protein